ncbi:hypothetical protein [Bradyrhizobium sp. USDA 4353]
MSVVGFGPGWFASGARSRMIRSAAATRLKRWSVIGLLGLIASALIYATHSGPAVYRPYYVLALLLHEPIDTVRLRPSDFYNGTFRERGKSLLICPATICRSAEKIDVEPQVFDESADRLLARLHAIIMAEPGAGAGYMPPGDPLRGRYILHESWRPPETIDLLVIAIDGTHATFALYARDLIRKLAPDRSERTARWLKALRDTP